MLRGNLALIALLLLAAPATAKSPATFCDDGKTQQDLNACAAGALEKAEAALAHALKAANARLKELPLPPE